MIGLDTNILVRFLIKDNEDECQRAFDLLNHNSGNIDSMYITDAVLCEVIWVLGSRYRRSKTELIETLELLTSMNEFKFSNHTTLKQAVELYKKGNASFTDYFIILKNKEAGCEYTYSFDKTLLKEEIAVPVPN